MFSKILIANRGEIACRIMRTARRLGLDCVAIYSDADRDAQHVAHADEAWHVGGAHASESYLAAERIVDIALGCGAEAVHPGYGFLAENAAFADACATRGIVFIGPPPAAIAAMGQKDAAKQLMREAGVPVVRGYDGVAQDAATLRANAEEIGYPILIKAAAGGGGKGMRRVDAAGDFDAALQSAMREANSAFGDERMLLEKYLTQARHVEVQIFADAHGNATHLFERDCSLQRRHQKVIEEAPAPGLPPDMRAAMGKAAINAARAVGYVGAGTVEFIADVSDGLHPERFYFMEMNTRLQVEHPVTEMITGQDLVEWQLRVAAGEPLPTSELHIEGHAIEVRVYAEDPARGFLPATGRLLHFRVPDDDAGVRVDTGVAQGDEITSHYDPMIAKLIVHAKDRASALRKMGWALERMVIDGCVTNLAFLQTLVQLPAFTNASMTTATIDEEVAAITAPASVPDDALALAALQAYGALSGKVAGDPWSSLPGWRLWGEADQLVHLIYENKTIAIAVVAQGGQQFHIELPRKTVSARVLGQMDRRVRLEIDGSIRTGTVVAAESELGVFVGGTRFNFTLPDALADSADAADTTSIVRSPLPGLIVDLKTTAGDAVTAGQALLVLEAMKMEHTLTAPRDGTIERVACAAGEQVLEGAILVVLEENAG